MYVQLINSACPVFLGNSILALSIGTACPLQNHPLYAKHRFDGQGWGMCPLPRSWCRRRGCGMRQKTTWQPWNLRGGSRESYGHSVRTQRQWTRLCELTSVFYKCYCKLSCTIDLHGHFWQIVWHPCAKYLNEEDDLKSKSKSCVHWTPTFVPQENNYQYLLCKIRY